MADLALIIFLVLMALVFGAGETKGCSESAGGTFRRHWRAAGKKETVAVDRFKTNRDDAQLVGHSDS